MAALLVALSVMAVLMSVALPQWSHQARREKEIELIWRGQQYARAIDLFQRRFANTFPPSIDVLVEQRFLRKKYKDPITGDDFQPLFVGQVMPGQVTPPGARPPAGGTQPSVQIRPGMTGNLGPIAGVASKSTDTSIRLWNGRDKYNEWTFVHVPAATRPDTPEGGQPGAQISGRPAPGSGGAGFGPAGPGSQPPQGQGGAAPAAPGGRPFGGTTPPTTTRPPVPRPPPL